MTTIEKAFEKMGATVRVSPVRRSGMRRRLGGGLEITPNAARIDIGHNGDGEFFDIQTNVDPEVIQVRPGLRHLLLMIRDGKDKNKYLCGHDERHWFVAAVPSDPGVTTVATAMKALKPKEASIGRRQGEWFFVPTPDFDEKGVRCRNEPISRGRGKPHMCEHLIRRGGTTVYLGFGLPDTGLTYEQYQKHIKTHPELGGKHTRTMTRDAEVFVKGAIRHPDHKTLHLDDWCQVFLNREQFAKHGQTVAFLD